MLLLETRKDAEEICGLNKSGANIAAANACLQLRAQKKQALWTGLFFGALAGVAAGFFIGRSKKTMHIIPNLSRAKFVHPIGVS